MKDEEKTEIEEGTRRLAVWHLIWAVPLVVAIVLGLWEYLEVHYIIDVEQATLSYIHLVRDVIIAFVITTVAVSLVIRDQKKHEKKLELTLSELKELDEMKNNFLSNVSHELRTPLTTINGYVKFMLSQKPGDLTEKQLKYLKVMSEESDRLQHHIDELLFITTLESKKMPLNLEEVDLSALVKRIKNTMKVKVKQKGLTLKTKVDEGLTVTGDENRLHQLLSNLVDNSIKYTNEGGKVLVTIKDVEKGIRIQVLDSGIGISPDKHQKVFKRFYQVDASLSREHGGTGLGLAICRAIVQTFGGTIRIISPLPQKKWKELGTEPGEGLKGTMFDIIIPRDISKATTERVAS